MSDSGSDSEPVRFADLLMDSQLRVESEFDRDGRRFLPERHLDSLLTEQNISDELKINLDSSKSKSIKNMSEAELAELITYIRTRSKKVFAIVASMEDGTPRAVMKTLMDGNFSDDCLPIEHPDVQQPHTLTLLGKGGTWWKVGRIEKFYDQQWRFLAPVFSVGADDTGADRPYRAPTIMPFTKRYDDEANVSEGAFGQVGKFEIHPCHLVDPSNPEKLWTDYVAVKEIKKDIMINWDKEATNLKKMNALQSDHIVRFLTAFRRGEDGTVRHFLMFEWADGGTLRNLWKTYPRPILTPGLVFAAVKQIEGLANAICMAHYPPGPLSTHFRHGDLKPENILWFKAKNAGGDDIGTLKIADWGLAKEQHVVTVLRSVNTSTKFGTRRYEPPEEETRLAVGLQTHHLVPDSNQTNRKGKRRSRLYDVWAMGCVTLEFIVWLMYGEDVLEQFHREFYVERLDRIDPFYQIRTDERGESFAQVHEVAVKWMDHMARDHICKPGETALGNLLEIVQRCLLVVNLPRDLGTSFGKTGHNTQAMGSTKSLRPRRGSSTSTTSTTSFLSDITAARVGSISSSEEDVTALVVPSIVFHDEANDDADDQAVTEAEPPSPFSIDPRGGGPGRTTADQLVNFLAEMIKDHDEEEYWLKGEPGPPPQFQSPQDVISHGASYQTEDSASTIQGDGRTADPVLIPGGLRPPEETRMDYGISQLDEDWETSIDNDFATQVIGGIASSPAFSAATNTTISSNLCRQCQELREGIWNTAFNKIYDVSALEANSSRCDLCGLLWRSCQRLNVTKLINIMFERAGSSLRMNGLSGRGLSIFRSPNLKTRADRETQIGFGKLPEGNDAAQFEIIKHWLRNCDENHKQTTCRPAPPGYAASSATASKTKRLPTRVIDTGSIGDEFVRLVETNPSHTGEWIALSHKWGLETSSHFCTTVDTVEDYKRGIPLASLPATFRDAVIVTRAIPGCQYLWIDSICILQGPGGDFNKEAKNVAEVYSGASLVLAVSRAAHQSDGFLKSLVPRDFVALSGRMGEPSRATPRTAQQQTGGGEDEAPFYICEDIDDFDAHVLKGPLNRRGWVLQEHALARRTVFFTDKQMYFECGEGVRCQTMTKMKNDVAAFLGDPNFPQIIGIGRAQGAKIIHYQNLFAQYSGLEFTRPFDRPVAIDGLQSRILSALRASGGYGIIDEGEQRGLLRRSLLWHRSSQTPSLKRIVFLPCHVISKVPSWSWMAYTGAIEYIKPNFSRVEWAPVQSPWFPPLTTTGTHAENDHHPIDLALVATAYRFDTSHMSGEPWLRLDEPAEPSSSGSSSRKVPVGADDGILCVVLGTQKEPGPSTSALTSQGTVRRLSFSSAPMPSNSKRGNLLSYFILVRPVQKDEKGNGADGANRSVRSTLYERVGAGYLPQKCIDLESGVTVTIV